MPFESQAQRSFMYAKHPAIAKRWEKETPAGKLPQHKRMALHMSALGMGKKKRKPVVRRSPGEIA